MASFKKGELNEAEIKLTELINAGKVEEVKALIAGKDVRNDCLDESGMTPLQHAAYRGNTELCRLLLAHGADINSNYHDSGYSALIFGALSGKVETVRLLLNAGARTGHTNSMGRTAAQMAGFVGQHQVVSLINNFLPREDLEYYTIVQGLETEPKLPPYLVGTLFLLLNQSNLDPVKISMQLQKSPEVLDNRYKVCKVLGLLLENNMKSHDTNEVMAMKLHYVTSLIHHVEKSYLDNDRKLDTWIKCLLRGRESDGFMETQEKLIRSTLREFPYIESQLLQQMVRSLASVPIGGSPSALSILKQGINGQRFGSDDDEICATCGEYEAKKKCSACKMVNYCNHECQKLHWFTHKKFCPALAEEYIQIEEQRRLMAEAEAKRKEEDAQKAEAEEERKKNTENETEGGEQTEVEEQDAIQAKDEEKKDAEKKKEMGENEDGEKAMLETNGKEKESTENAKEDGGQIEKNLIPEKMEGSMEDSKDSVSDVAEKLQKISVTDKEHDGAAAGDTEDGSDRPVSMCDVTVDFNSQ